MASNVMFPYAPYAISVSGAYLGGGGSTPGPPGPPGPTGPPGAPNPLSTMTYIENLSETNAGDINLNLLSMSVSSSSPTLHPAMIFNSNVPTGGNTELGSPNVAFGGPGVGAGGGAGPGANTNALGNIWIISDDANPAIPKSYPAGGTITFSFTNPVNTVSLALLNVADPGWQILIYDASGLVATLPITVLGLNSYQLVSLAYNLVTTVEVVMTGIGGISAFTYVRSISSGTSYGYINIIDDGSVATTLSPAQMGSYQIIVESISAGGATAVFSATKAIAATGGNLSRINSSIASGGEQLQILWNPSSGIQLIHSIPATIPTGALIAYKYAIISSL